MTSPALALSGSRVKSRPRQPWPPRMGPPPGLPSSHLGCLGGAEWRLHGPDCELKPHQWTEWSQAWASRCGCTCGVPAGGRAVWGPVDEAPKGADGVGAHQGVAAEGPAVHHSDVQGRVQEFILRKVLGCWPMEPELREGGRGTGLCPATPAAPSSARLFLGLHPPLQTT